MHSLPKALGRFPRHLEGTNFEYALRIVHQGDDILYRGDSLVERFKFTPRDLNQSLKDTRTLQKCIEAPQSVALHEGRCLFDLPKHLGKILTYHLDKALACNAEYTRLHNKITTGRDAFIKACQNGDYKTLAGFYPYSDGVLEIEGKNVLPRVLTKFMDMPKDWYTEQRAMKIAECFHNATSLNSLTVTSQLGRPDYGVNEMCFGALAQDRERNMRVWSQGQSYIAEFSEMTGRPLPAAGLTFA